MALIDFLIVQPYICKNADNKCNISLGFLLIQSEGNPYTSQPMYLNHHHSLITGFLPWDENVHDLCNCLHVLLCCYVLDSWCE